VLPFQVLLDYRHSLSIPPKTKGTADTAPHTAARPHARLALLMLHDLFEQFNDLLRPKCINLG
jgi:hypothetical protein